MEQNKILLVDNEINVCRGCQRIFEEEGYIADYALSGEEGLRKMEEGEFDVVITDLKMPGINGIEVIKQVKLKNPEMPVIMITGYASVPTAVEAMKLGAEHYIPKPLEPDELLDVVHSAMEKANYAHKEAISKPVKKEIPKKKAGNKEIIEKDQVLAVLNRVSEDSDFWTNLMLNGSKALEGYKISNEAKAAIISGDIRWIEKNIGRLTENQLKYLKLRLQTESW